MGKFNKLWVSMLGTGVLLLLESGIISTGQSETLMQSGVALLTTFGVYQVPNRS